jgi:hypothetical protein
MTGFLWGAIETLYRTVVINIQYQKNLEVGVCGALERRSNFLISSFKIVLISMAFLFPSLALADSRHGFLLVPGYVQGKTAGAEVSLLLVTGKHRPIFGAVLGKSDVGEKSHYVEAEVGFVIANNERLPSAFGLFVGTGVVTDNQNNTGQQWTVSALTLVLLPYYRQIRFKEQTKEEWGFMIKVPIELFEF